MQDEGLFEIAGITLKGGEIYTGVSKTVELIEKDPDLSARLAGVCALAKRQALEADNIDPTEKAYARTKLHDSLSRNLELLMRALEGSGTSGALEATLNVIISDDTDEGDDL